MIESVGTLLAAAAAGDAPAAGAATALSVWELVVKGGWMMVPIGVFSLVGLAIVVERLVALRRSAVIPPGFVEELKGKLSGPGTDAKAALEMCSRDGSPVAHVLRAGIKRLHEPAETLERHINEAGEREAIRLRKRLRALSVIASVSPLMGLLGTIFGMIAAFQTVAGSGDALGRAELLAGGIYEALITTAAGLLVAIPALLCHHWIAAKIERLVMEIDAIAMDFVEERTLPGAGDGASGAPGAGAGESRSAGPVRDSAESVNGMVGATASAGSGAGEIRLASE